MSQDVQLTGQHSGAFFREALTVDRAMPATVDTQPSSMPAVMQRAALGQEQFYGQRETDPQEGRQHEDNARHVAATTTLNAS